MSEDRFPELTALRAPTPPSEIRQRQGPGGRMLDYVDARYVMEVLDRCVGPECWQDQYVDRPNGTVRCGIGIQVDGEWIWKWDVGDVSDIEPDKGAYSEAFKRAAVKWGIARDLYGHSSGRGASSPRPAPEPRPVPPTTVRGGAVPEEPDYLREAEHVFSDVRPVTDQRRDEASTNDGFCPAHGKAWVNGKYGWYCTGKAVDGFKSNDRGYCAEKPSARWAALQERA